MWVFSQYGFYSIVEKQSGVFQVRSRSREDLENLIRHSGMYFAVIDTPQGDYSHRIEITRSELDFIFETLAQSVDYPNFKDKVAKTKQKSRLKMFHDIWELVYMAYYKGRFWK